MSLKASEQIVLDVIEHNLRAADPELSVAFESFTTVTAHAALPESEQLSGQHKPTAETASRGPQGPQGPEPAKITFAMRLAILFLVGMVLAGTVLALFSGPRGSGCAGSTGPGTAQAKAAGGLLHGRTAPSCSGLVHR
jgi:hypothetical protein